MTDVLQRIEHTDIDPVTQKSIFYNGPVEFLVQTCVQEIRKVKQFAALFGITESDTEGFIDSYQRMDYPMRALPALRVYNKAFDKAFDSWFVEGDLTLDVIFPADIRRNQTQQVQDTISSAVLQQFRRTHFFTAVESLVPGLNELGKRFSVDKALGFEWGENIVPLTQMRVNFKIDLREWDDYLETTNRTKDDPFEQTLANLENIVSVVQGLRDNGEVEVDTVRIDQQI